MSSFERRIKDIEEIADSIDLEYMIFCPKNAREEELFIDECDDKHESVNVAILRIYDRD